MDEKFDIVIFGNKKFGKILEEIYQNSKKKEKQISNLIKELNELIEGDMTAALQLVPLIKEYLDIGVKNDEHLIKMATVIQRVLSSSKSGDSNSGMLSEEERKQLEEVAKQANEYIEQQKK